MPTINENFLKLEKNYLFINIAKKVNAFMAENPDAPLIRMGIGDVTLPIAPVCVHIYLLKNIISAIMPVV